MISQSSGKAPPSPSAATLGWAHGAITLLPGNGTSSIFLTPSSTTSTGMLPGMVYPTGTLGLSGGPLGLLTTLGGNSSRNKPGQRKHPPTLKYADSNPYPFIKPPRHERSVSAVRRAYYIIFCRLF